METSSVLHIEYYLVLWTSSIDCLGHTEIDINKCLKLSAVRLGVEGEAGVVRAETLSLPVVHVLQSLLGKGLPE